MAQGKRRTRRLVHVTPTVDDLTSSGSDKDFDPNASNDGEHAYSDGISGDVETSQSIEIPEQAKKQANKKSRKVHTKHNKNKNGKVPIEGRNEKSGNNLTEQKKKKSGQATFLSRCSPNRLQTICNDLTQEQRETVIEMGFGGLLHVKCTRLDRRVCLKLIKCFDLRQLCVYAKGEEIRLSYRDVGKVFGLPHGGLDIPEGATVEQKTMLREFDGISDVQLRQIIGQGKVNDQFRRAFILYVLSCFLCPTLKMAPCPKLLGSIVDIHNVKKYNWSLFVFNWLVRNLKSYKARQYKSKIAGIGGCIFFLKIMYFHSRPLGITPSNHEYPLVKFWDDNMVEKRIREENNNVLGLLYERKDKGDLVDPVWLKENFETELFRNLVAESIRMYKAQEEAALAKTGVVFSSTLRPPAPKEKRMASADKEISFSNTEMTSLKASERSMDKDENIEDDGGLTSGVIVPTVERHGQTKALNALYEYCIRKETAAKSKQEVLVSMCGHFMTRGDTMTMGRRRKLNNHVVSFAAAVLNETHIASSSKSRYCLSSYFMDSVKADLDNFMKDKHLPWHKFPAFSPINEPSVINCDLLFAPVVFGNHWWCYVLERRKMKLYVLDSLWWEHKGNMALLDKLTAKRFGEMLALLDKNLAITDVQLDIEFPSVPKQPNGYDCGVHTIKYMELWDGDTTYEGGHTMPTWSEGEIGGIRQDLLINWVLHANNKEREHVCKAAKVDELLSTPSASIIGSPSYERVSSPQVEACGAFSFDKGVGETTYGNEGEASAGKSYHPSNISTRVKQKTYQRKRKPGPHQQTPYTASHLRPRKKI